MPRKKTTTTMEPMEATEAAVQAESEAAEQEEAFDFTPWLPTIYQLFDDSEILMIAKVVGAEIAGFGPRSLHKAPKLMLRKKTLEKLTNVANPLKFINSLYKPYLSKVKDEEAPEDLMWRMTQEEYTPSAKLAVLGIKKPEFFRQAEKKIKANLKQKKDPLAGLVETPSFEKQVKLQFPAMLDETLKKLGERDHFAKENDIPEDNLLEHLKNNVDLKQSAGKHIALAIHQTEQWKEWEAGDRNAFFQLVMLDALNAINRQQEELAAQTRELQELQEKLQSAEEANQVLAEKCREEEEKVQSLTKEREALQLEIEQLKQQEQQTAKENREVISHEPIITEPNLKLVLFQERPELLHYISEEQIHVLTGVKQLSAILKNRAPDTLWFIDSEHVSTKEMFQAEQAMQKQKAAFRFVSGSTAEIVRKIIFNLEGDMIYEAY